MANVALVLTIFEGLGIPVALGQARGPLFCPHIPGNRTGHRPRDNQAINPETAEAAKLARYLSRKESRCKEGLGIPGGEIITCMQGSQARQNIPQKNV